MLGADIDALRRVFSLVVYLDSASLLSLSFFRLIDLPHNLHPTTAVIARRTPAAEPPMMDAKGTVDLADVDGCEAGVDEGPGENIVVVTTWTAPSSEESTGDIIYDVSNNR